MLAASSRCAASGVTACAMPAGSAPGRRIPSTPLRTISAGPPRPTATTGFSRGHGFHDHPAKGSRLAGWSSRSMLSSTAAMSLRNRQRQPCPSAPAARLGFEAPAGSGADRRTDRRPRPESAPPAVGRQSAARLRKTACPFTEPTGRPWPPQTRSRRFPSAGARRAEPRGRKRSVSMPL